MGCYHDSEWSWLGSPYSSGPAAGPRQDTNATRYFNKPLNNARSLPLGFFDDTQDHIHAPSTRPYTRSSALQSVALRPRSLLERFSSLFVHPHSSVRNTTSYGRSTSLFPSTLTHFSRHHRSNNEGPPLEVEIPSVRGDPRNVHATQAKSNCVTAQSNIMMLTVGSPSQPPNSGQSSEDASGQSVLQSQLAVNSTPAAAAAAINTAAPSHPEAVSDIRQSGCWARFWLFVCCISAETHN